ncbi:MAG: hypothetical protein OXB98_19455 [Bryobacterales bacterium]|nr:hypothetical protein [Bryobacterales bacterium]
MIAHFDGIFTGAAEVVTVEAGVDATADFLLELKPQRYEITVTPGEKQETAFEAFQSVDSIAAYDLTESTVVSLGETLDHMVGTGIAVSRRHEMHRHPHRACVVLSRLGRVDQHPRRSQRRFEYGHKKWMLWGQGARAAGCEPVTTRPRYRVRSSTPALSRPTAAASDGRATRPSSASTPSTTKAPTASPSTKSSTEDTTKKRTNMTRRTPRLTAMPSPAG